MILPARDRRFGWSCSSLRSMPRSARGPSLVDMTFPYAVNRRLLELARAGAAIATPIVHGGGRTETPAVSAAEHTGATPRGDDVVRATRLTKRFGDATVVDNVDLRVPRGTSFAYLGPNGAGKTTLIRMLLGLIRSTSGEMELLGLPVPAKRRQALARVGAIVDEPRFPKPITGRQNLWVLAAALERGAHGRIDDALARVRLLAPAHAPPRTPP